MHLHPESAKKFDNPMNTYENVMCAYAGILFIFKFIYLGPHASG